jgi:hypothetical protein
MIPLWNSQEHRDKISRGKLQSNYQHSEETKNKISETLTGRHRPDDVKKKISETMKLVRAAKKVAASKRALQC